MEDTIDYRKVFAHIYTQPGSIWQPPNNTWNRFGRNDTDRHPGLVEYVKAGGFAVQIAPGTSQEYEIGRAVFETNLGNTEVITHFLLRLSMPMNIDNLIAIDRGWNGYKHLKRNVLQEFILQLKLYMGWI